MDRIWKLKAKVNEHVFGLFLDCMVDISDAICRVDELNRNGRLSSNTFVRAARGISVAIRKVIIDNNGGLFKTCFEPKLHRLRKPQIHQKGPDILVEKIDGMEVKLLVGNTDTERSVLGPSYEHRTVVYTPYGLRKTDTEKYSLDMPFDLSLQPIKLGRWLKIKVFQVDDTVITVEEMLRTLVNKEGAHVETDEMTHMSFSMPVKVTMEDRTDELYRKCNLLLFDEISYLHLFTYLIGFYFVEMMKLTWHSLPVRIEDRLRYRDSMHAILKTPSKIASLNFDLKKQFGIGIVFRATGSPESPLETVGDYENAGITTIKIPGMITHENV